MNVTIETFFCPYCDEVTEIYFRLVNTILFADGEESLRQGLERLKTQVPLDDYFVYGFGAHHLWVHQRKPSDQTQQGKNATSILPHSFPTPKETSLSIRLPTHGRRIVLLRRPDIGGVPRKTGYMVE